MADTRIRISRVSWEMAQWEIHALRTLVTQLMGFIRMHRAMTRKGEAVPASADELDAEARRLRRQFLQNLERALFDHAYRRRVLLKSELPIPLADDLAPEVPTDAE